MAEQPPRHVAPGGVRRMIIGFVCGLLAGAAIALVLPRDDGPPPRAAQPRPDPDRNEAGSGPTVERASDLSADATTGAQRRPPAADADPGPGRTSEVGDLRGN